MMTKLEMEERIEEFMDTKVGRYEVLNNGEIEEMFNIMLREF